MKITDIKVITYTQPTPPVLRKRMKGTQELSLVSIETDEGITGYSMARANGGPTGKVIGEYIIFTLKRLLIGQDPLDREKIWQAMWGQEKSSYIPIFPLSAVDVALWDLAGKYFKLPVYKLIGGYRDKIETYASSAFLTKIDEYIEDALEVVNKGINGYKIHPIQNPSEDITLCRELRKILPDSMKLMLDPGGVYDRADALRIGKVIQDLDFLWYEEPLPHYDLKGYADLKQKLNIPIVGAESIPGSIFSSALFIENDSLDLIECDAYWRGGITGYLKTAHLCEAHNIKMISHHGGSPIMNAANLHALCSIKNCDLIEVLVPDKEYNYGLSSYPETDKEGFLAPFPAPGLGVEIDWDYIKEHQTHSM